MRHFASETRLVEVKSSALSPPPKPTFDTVKTTTPIITRIYRSRLQALLRIDNSKESLTVSMRGVSQQ